MSPVLDNRCGLWSALINSRFVRTLECFCELITDAFKFSRPQTAGRDYPAGLPPPSLNTLHVDDDRSDVLLLCSRVFGKNTPAIG